MSEPRQAPFGRADKAACWLLRARLYLNAEVYTGQPRWNDAITYAGKVLDPSNGYGLCGNYEQLLWQTMMKIPMLKRNHPFYPSGWCTSKELRRKLLPDCCNAKERHAESRNK